MFVASRKEKKTPAAFPPQLLVSRAFSRKKRRPILVRDSFSLKSIIFCMAFHHFYSLERFFSRDNSLDSYHPTRYTFRKLKKGGGRENGRELHNPWLPFRSPQIEAGGFLLSSFFAVIHQPSSHFHLLLLLLWMSSPLFFIL